VRIAMRVALLHNLRRGNEEVESEFDEPLTITALCESIGRRYEVVSVECGPGVHDWVNKLASVSPDLVFNVAEGYRGAARESLFAAVCEELGFPYCGPGPTELLICHNKALTKKLLQGSGVPMAWGALVGSEEDLRVLDATVLPFPLFVKLNSEGSSMGVGPESIVTDRSSLLTQVRRMLDRYESNILVEEYKPGRDISLSFVEGLGVLGPAEYTYPTGTVYDFEWKTIRNDRVDVVAVSDLPSSTVDALRRVAQRVVDELDIAGYSRLDFRVSPQGELCFLEANAQVSFHPKGAFVVGAEAAGYSFDDVVLHVVRWGCENRRRSCRVGHDYSRSIRR
jgi:D-alanine-D-alanine ligase